MKTLIASLALTFAVTSPVFARGDSETASQGVPSSLTKKVHMKKSFKAYGFKKGSFFKSDKFEQPVYSDRAIDDGIPSSLRPAEYR